jgi:hypothetical protein
MIEFKCDDDYLAKVRAFADSLGLRDQLEKQFDYLSTYASNGGTKENVCIIGKDFAPHSFAFAIYQIRDGERRYWFNGGLIYQGPDSPADGGAPSFTVSLAEGRGWFVHT